MRQTPPLVCTMQCTAALQRAPRRRLRPRSAFVAHSPLPQGSVTDSFSSPVLSRLLQELVSPLPDLLAPLCVILRGHHNHSLSLCHAPATPAPLHHHQTSLLSSSSHLRQLRCTPPTAAHTHPRLDDDDRYTPATATASTTAMLCTKDPLLPVAYMNCHQPWHMRHGCHIHPLKRANCNPVRECCPSHRTVALRCSGSSQDTSSRYPAIPIPQPSSHPHPRLPAKDNARSSTPE